MKISSLKFANILITAVLLVSPFVVGMTASQYDPWADINDDGKIDIKDIAYTAKLFGTLGDPTKTVEIGNHATYECTLVKTLTFNSYWLIRNTTKGYDRVSITVSIDYNWHVYAYVGFICNGSAGEISSPADTLSLWDVYKVSKTYEVTGSTIYVNIWNSDASSIDVKVGIYMTT